MRTQTFGITEFRLTVKTGGDGFFFVLSGEEPWNNGTYGIWRREMAIKDDKLPEHPFTIEGLPGGTKDVDCFGNNTYLEPYSCKGAITMY